MIDNMTKLAMAKERYRVLSNRGDKNEKSPGVLKKLARQIRNLEKEVS